MKTGDELSEEGGRYAHAIRPAMELPLGGKCLPKGVGSSLAENFKVSKNVPDELLKRVKEQLAEGYTLDPITRKRSGRFLDSVEDEK